MKGAFAERGPLYITIAKRKKGKGKQEGEEEKGMVMHLVLVRGVELLHDGGKQSTHLHLESCLGPIAPC